MADAIDRAFDWCAVFGPKPDESPAEGSPFEYLSMQHDRAFEHHSGAGLELLPRVGQRLPVLLAVGPPGSTISGRV